MRAGLAGCKVGRHARMDSERPGRGALDTHADLGRANVRHRLRSRHSRRDPRPVRGRRGEEARAVRASVGALRERFRALLHLDDPPWRVALALAVGVFISFTPFVGFQTLLALLVAAACRLNAAVLVTGTWLNLPWFMPFVYAGALKLGAALLPDLHGLGGWSLALLIGT